jgi:hypothetical protein
LVKRSLITPWYDSSGPVVLGVSASRKAAIHILYFSCEIHSFSKYA